MWEVEQRASPEGSQLAAVFSGMKLLLMAADIRTCDMSEAGTRAIELLMKEGRGAGTKATMGAQKPFEAETSSRLQRKLCRLE